MTQYADFASVSLLVWLVSPNGAKGAGWGIKLKSLIIRYIGYEAMYKAHRRWSESATEAQKSTITLVLMVLSDTPGGNQVVTLKN